jgi:hypothetical protein
LWRSKPLATDELYDVEMMDPLRVVWRDLMWVSKVHALEVVEVWMRVITPSHLFDLSHRIKLVEGDGGEE